MDLKRWFLATVGAFAVIVMGDTLIHHVWLGAFYQAHAQWWRPAAQMQQVMGFMFASEISLAVLLTFIYSKGYEHHKGTVSQGFRFGVLMGFLLTVPCGLMNYFVYPYPLSLILNWTIGGIVETVAAGMMIGFLYKPAK